MHDLSPPRYETVTGPDAESLVICDAILTVSRHTVMCSGGGNDQSEAYAKMLSEAAERIVYFDCLKQGTAPASSTGFAAHTSLVDAEQAARNELIERSFVDRLRRNPQSVMPERSCDRSWIYRIPEHDCWICIARANTTDTSGWGARVDTDACCAKHAAVLEGFMMASSHASYGRRGNAITALAGGGEKLGGEIRIRHFPVVSLNDETRHACCAYWATT